MNIKELKDIISAIDETKISFSIGDQVLSSNFDHAENDYMEEDDYNTSISYCIYSWIANAIFFKAQGKESCSKGKECFKDTFDHIVSLQDDNVRLDSKVEADNALQLIDNFFQSKEDIKLAQFMAILAPLAVLKLISENKGNDKEIMKSFSKNKEMIFNQVILFSRSLFHSFLKKSSTAADKIRPDYQKLDNGIFLYNNETLIIPTWKNAFTLKGYKEIILDGLNNISQCFPISNINSVSVIYLVRDLFVEYKF